jgi:TfoX/Sxy family transcriptional regulator of competence genes
MMTQEGNMPAKPKSSMPKWKAAPPELVARFNDAIRPLPQVEPRKMFGYPSAFAGGQMFAGLFADKMMIRLSEADRADFLALKGAQIFEPMPGRPMKEYVLVPPEVLDDEATLDGWLRRSMAYAQSLPPKKAKKKK